MNKKTATLFSTTLSIVIGTLLAALLVGSINAAPLPQTAPTATTLTTGTATAETTATTLVSPTSLTTATALVSPTTLATDTALTPVSTVVATTTSPSTLPSTGGSDNSIWLFVAIAGIALFIGAILMLGNRQGPSNS